MREFNNEPVLIPGHKRFRNMTPLTQNKTQLQNFLNLYSENSFFFVFVVTHCLHMKKNYKKLDSFSASGQYCTYGYAVFMESYLDLPNLVPLLLVIDYLVAEKCAVKFARKICCCTYWCQL